MKLFKRLFYIYSKYKMESSSGRIYTNEQIVKVLDQYERKLKSMNKFYVNKYNTDEEFRQKKLQQSRENYQKKKEYYRQYYLKKKAKNQSLSSSEESVSDSS